MPGASQGMAGMLGAGTSPLDEEESGSMLGPIGALAGGAVGAGASLLDFGAQRKARKKAERASRPKHRRLTAIKQTMDEQQEKKLASMAALSSAAMQWANMIR